jgi:hypothetical protein
MNTLTEGEEKFIKMYKNYSKLINDPKFKILDDKWTREGTKERTWIHIYNKMPIHFRVETLVFNPVFNEGSVITEMENYINTNIIISEDTG